MDTSTNPTIQDLLNLHRHVVKLLARVEMLEAKEQVHTDLLAQLFERLKVLEPTALADNCADCEYHRFSDLKRNDRPPMGGGPAKVCTVTGVRSYCWEGQTCGISLKKSR